MQLLTKAIKAKAEKQFPLGSSLETQKVVAKFFDPVGSWTWYLMNIDPEDENYAWGIVKGAEVEMGSFSLKDLQEHKGRFGLGIERDLWFTPVNASELWERLTKGEHV